ncbi:MAG: hypothetical protein V3S26_04780 [Acidimicrobiia bacterium]
MQHLRPLERRVLSMVDDGVGIDEISSRIRKSPEHVERIIQWTSIPRSKPSERRSPSPVERRVLALLDAGETHEEVGRRFRRGADYIRQVEGLAHYRLGLELLGGRRPEPEDSSA